MEVISYRRPLATNASSQTPSPIRFSDTAQIQTTYLYPEMNNTKPIELEVFPLLLAPNPFGVY